MAAATTSDAAVPTVRTVRFGPVSVDYDERVLAPRGWTLAQSEWAAELAAKAPPGPILELCAGAGQIGLAAAVLADRDLVQVEADPVAAAYALANAVRAGRAERVDVRPSRLEDALRPDETFPIVVADPPYLPTAEVSRWPDDPVTAIDGGADGLHVVRGVLDVAAGHLLPGGFLLLQVAGPAQAARVENLLERSVTVSDGSPLVAGPVRVTDDRRAVLLISRTGRVHPQRQQ